VNEISVVEKLKTYFTCYEAELEYLPNQRRFAWWPEKPKPLPTHHGVYLLFSHGDARLQNVGKAEGENGLRQRFVGYTAAKTEEKLRKDRTDQRWRRIMTGELRGERVSVYYLIITPSMKVELLDEEIDCRSARSLEGHLRKVLRNECRARNLLETHLLLMGDIGRASRSRIAGTFPLGTVGHEPEPISKGERIWLEASVLDRLRALRGPGESYSDVILRLAKGSA
jgi:hypothetical protein